MLGRWVAQRSRDSGVAVGRLRRGISFMVLAGALDKVRDSDSGPLFVIKGGVGMELRLNHRARASKDFDAIFREEMENLLDRLDQAFLDPYEGFAMTRNEPARIRGSNSVRVEIRLSFNGRSWGTVPIEIAPVEEPEVLSIDQIAAIDISKFGLDGPEELPCVGIPYQMAQKLHACTERFDTGSENDRHHDLIDIILLDDLLHESQLGSVRRACVAIFENRSAQPWPPVLDVPATWAEPYKRLALEIEFEVAEVERAADLVREIIAKIDAAS